jgi:hypothetical protein
VARTFAALLLVGVFAGFIALSGIDSYMTNASGTVVSHAGAAARSIAGAVSVLSLGFAWGISRQTLLSWEEVYPVFGIVWVAAVIGGTRAAALHFSAGPYRDRAIGLGVALLIAGPALTWLIRRRFWPPGGGE